MFIRKMSKTVDNYATVFEYWFLKKPEPESKPISDLKSNKKPKKMTTDNIKSGPKIATSIYLTATDTKVNGISPVETGRLKKARQAYKNIKNDNKFKKMTQAVVETLEKDKTDKALQEALQNLVNLKRIRRLFLTSTSYHTVFGNVKNVTREQVFEQKIQKETKKRTDDDLLINFLLPYWFLKKTPKGEGKAIPKPIEQVIASIYRTGVKEAPKAVKDTSRLAKARLAYKKLSDTNKLDIGSIVGQLDNTKPDINTIKLAYNNLKDLPSEYKCEIDAPEFSNINIDDILNEIEIRKDTYKNTRDKARANKGHLTKIRKLDNKITDLLGHDITKIDNEKLDKYLVNVGELHTQIDNNYKKNEKYDANFDIRMKLLKKTEDKICDKGIAIQEEFENYSPEKDKIENLEEKYNILSKIHDHSGVFLTGSRLTQFKNALEKVEPYLEEK